MIMSARQAEHCARLAWEAFVRLTSSEVAAQETIGGTPKDFEMYAVQFLVQSFMAGKVPPIGKRIDLIKGHAQEDETGDYHFDRRENVEAMTYAQAMLALQEAVPQEYRRKFKQLHAKGASAYEAYQQVMREWDQLKMAWRD